MSLPRDTAEDRDSAGPAACVGGMHAGGLLPMLGLCGGQGHYGAWHVTAKAQDLPRPEEVRGDALWEADL